MGCQVKDLIPAIDDNGSLYPIDKMDAHRHGILHLAVSVFVFSGRELLIQRRAAGKYHSGLLWANTCCSHPQWNEPVAEAAHRRLHEELGFELDLRPTTVFNYVSQVTGDLLENESVHVFRGEADKLKLILSPNPGEVAETRWATISSVQDEINRTPEHFASWFRIYVDRWPELGLC
jgi:isopentenyl-diphosphate delta-isomerase